MHPASFYLENSCSPERGKHGRLPLTPNAQKDWVRFAAIVPLNPKF